MLIAFSLIALISLLLFSGLRLGMRAWESVENMIELNAEQRITRNFIERSLGQARSVSVTLDAEPVLIFSGDSENLEFVAPLSQQVGIPGLYILRLGLDTGKENTLLLTRWLLHPDVLEGTAEIPEWEPFDGGIGLSIAGQEDRDVAAGAFGTTRLIESVEELEIAYFGPASDNQGGRPVEDLDAEWQSDWIDRPNPPYAVRIRLTTPRSSWPDLVVRLPESSER